jgi:hypothetical protein
VRSINPPSPQDSVTGTILADDPDGLDSVWLRVDTDQAGEDAGFDRTFSTRFRFTIRAGHPATTQIPVRLRARDVVGFEAERDTYVVVIP